MRKFLPRTCLAMLALNLVPQISDAMDANEVTATEGTRRVQNEQAAKDYFGSNITPKVALYGEGPVHAKEADYTLFLTVDCQDSFNPTIVADITNLEDMAVIPDGQLDQVELRDIPTPVFSCNPEAIFRDIARVLKQGGMLKFNNMWGDCDAGDLKSNFLKVREGLKETKPEIYAKIEATPAKDLVLMLQSRCQLNPFDQYLEESDYSELKGKKLQETSLFAPYTVQLSTFFEKVGFTNPVFYGQQGDNFWTVVKK